tara:strand:+ start:951 stop:1190 length:240 start_codon:yes stop_codon:yes gene_type:complete
MLVGIILFILLCYLVGHLVGPSKKQILRDTESKYQALLYESHKRSDKLTEMYETLIKENKELKELVEDMSNIEIICGDR